MDGWMDCGVGGSQRQLRAFGQKTRTSGRRGRSFWVEQAGRGRRAREDNDEDADKHNKHHPIPIVRLVYCSCCIFLDPWLIVCLLLLPSVKVHRDLPEHQQRVPPQHVRQQPTRTVRPRKHGQRLGRHGQRRLRRHGNGRRRWRPHSQQFQRASRQDDAWWRK